MIQLDKSIYSSIKEKYVRQLLPIIKENYNLNKNKACTLFFNNIRAIDFVEKNGEFNEEKVTNLLIIDFENKSDDKRITNYFKTAYLSKCSYNFILNILENRNIENSKCTRENIIHELFNKYNNAFIKDILSIHPKALNNIKQFTEMTKHIHEEMNKLNEEIKLIISYDYIDSEFRNEIIISTNVTVCPYCNRNFISNFDTKKRTTADLDHFYPTSVYQLFSLSLYNFIPSCPICNRNFKKNSTLEILYPFEKGFDNDAQFEIIFNENSTYETYMGRNQNFDLKLIIKPNNDYYEKISNNNKLFNLESIYESHKKYAQELLLKKYVYNNKSYFKMLKELFMLEELSDEEINILLYGYAFNDNDDDKILYKLTKDILQK